MRNFIVLISTCDWLIPKFVSNFYLGGLGSCARTVSHIFLFKGGPFLKFYWLAWAPLNHLSELCVYIFNLNETK